MMKNSTLIDGVSSDQITNLFARLENQISELQKNFQPKVPTEYLTRNDVAEMLKCDLSTVHNYTKRGLLIPWGIGSRVYYKRHEVESALIPFGKNKGGKV